MASSDVSPRNNGSLTHPLIPLNGSGRESAADLCQLATALVQALPGRVQHLTVRSGDREVQIEWSSPAMDVVGEQGGSRPHPGTVADGGMLGGRSWTEGATVTPPPAAGTVDATGATRQVAGLAVRAPLVGTYFAAPAPDADPFVTVGDTVESGATIAIIEAMKMMNPILAPQSGVVAELPVTNGEPVEYDQILVLITPFEVSAEQRR